MKIVTVVGIRGSGKTTVVEALTRELIRRGYAVGTVKSVFCPTFHMDKPGSNTHRHAQAGACVVTARAAAETTILYPRPLRPSQILAHYTDCDWVLCEGDYELPAARIVAAHGEKDAAERLNDRTLAVSGLIANGEERQLNGLPVLHPERDIAQLADLLIARVAECGSLEALDASLRGADIALSQAYCAQGCRGHAPKPASGVRLVVDGKSVTLTAGQEALLRSWAQGEKDA